jgi:hypothetical protein
MFRYLRWLSALALGALWACAPVGAAPLPWTFEGLLTRVDPVLAPELKSGWVLSGTFALDFMEMEEDGETGPAARAGRLVGGISGTELTVDLYYRLHFEAWQAEGLAGFDFLDDDPDADGRDVMGWFFPMAGRLKDSPWSLDWLQIWISDPGGKMIRTRPPVIPPSGLAWQAGWFRMAFSDADGAAAYAEGPLDLFAPVAEADESQRERDWARMVRDLGARLEDRDRELAAVREELAQASARVQGLRNMVDLLVQERSHLEAENARLREQATLVDPEAEQRMADLLAGKALLEQELSDLDGRNLALVDRLEASERERLKLLERIGDLEAEAAEPVEAPARVRSREPVTGPEGREFGFITVFEQPMVVEKPVPMPVPQALRQPSESQAPPAPETPARRFGPRKFR